LVEQIGGWQPRDDRDALTAVSWTCSACWQRARATRNQRPTHIAHGTVRPVGNIFQKLGVSCTEAGVLLALSDGLVT
jgi:hypothetical protein